MSHFTSGNMNKTRKKGWTFFWVFMLVHIVYVALGFGVSFIVQQDFVLFMGGPLFFVLVSFAAMILPAAAATGVYCVSDRSPKVYLCPLVLLFLNLLIYVLYICMHTELLLLPSSVVFPVLYFLQTGWMSEMLFEIVSFIIMPSLIYALEILVTTLVLRKYFFTIENQYVE